MLMPVDKVASDEAVPASTRVVVIGGGIIGTCTALSLAERGVPVVLAEKGEIAGEQSSRNMGWCRKMGRDPRELPLIIESMRLWDGMKARIGRDTGFTTCGIMYLCDSQAELASHEAWLAYARPYQLDTRMVTPAEIDTLMPGNKARWVGGMYTASDARGEPQHAAPAIAEAAREAGAIILTNCAVRTVETAGGRVTAVVTERGRIACDSVVLAGGAWSSLFCGNLDLRLPQLRIKTSILRTEPISGGPEISTSGGGFGMRKRLDGGYNMMQFRGDIVDIVPDSFRFLPEFRQIAVSEGKNMAYRFGGAFFDALKQRRHWDGAAPSPFEAERIIDPPPHEPSLARGRRRITAAFPHLANARIRDSWAGMIDVTPDAIPVISGIDAMPGFFVATGFSGHGFGIGPGAGRLMADIVTGTSPVVDPRPFRFSRFAEPGGIQPGKAA
jgi:glycine/D-amino acid oxidase-like deaminating enzyme